MLCEGFFIALKLLLSTLKAYITAPISYVLNNKFMAENSLFSFLTSINKLLFFVLTVASLSACNTVQGFGKDIEKGGEAIQKSAK